MPVPVAELNRELFDMKFDAKKCNAKWLMTKMGSVKGIDSCVEMDKKKHSITGDVAWS